MNLNHLSIFRAVAEEKSISRGAERLMISQPAVSKQLRLLEKSLGQVLLDRLPRGIRLTAAGELLLGHARRLFAVEAEAEDALSQLKGIRRGNLAIGASTTVGIYRLPGLFVQFRREHPAVSSRLEIADSTQLCDWLLDDRLDMAFTEGELNHAELSSEPVWTDELIAIAPRGHPLSRRRHISLERLCQEPFVVRESGSASKSLVERTLAAKGWIVNPAMSLGSTEAIKQAVAAGVGVAVVSRMAVDMELKGGRLAILRVAGLPIRRPVHLVRRLLRHPSATATAFEKLARQRLNGSTAN